MDEVTNWTCPLAGFSVMPPAPEEMVKSATLSNTCPFTLRKRKIEMDSIKRSQRTQPSFLRNFKCPLAGANTRPVPAEDDKIGSWLATTGFMNSRISVATESVEEDEEIYRTNKDEQNTWAS